MTENKKIENRKGRLKSLEREEKKRRKKDDKKDVEGFGCDAGRSRVLHNKKRGL